MNEEVRHFSLRKLSVGLASVLIGVSIFSTSQTVKADTVASNQTSSVTSNAQSSDTQENENAVKSSFSNDNQANNVKNNLIQTQVEGKKDQKQDSASKTQEATDGSNLDAEKDIARTSSLQEPDNQSNNHAEDNSQTQTGQKLDLTKSSKKFAKKVLATNLIATPPVTNGGFDEATWGKLDVNNWQGSAQNGVYQLTNYTGDLSHIIVPNEADFEEAGKSTNGLQVGIDKYTVRSLLSRTNQEKTIAFSKTNNQKVKAIGTDWWGAFLSISLSKFDGSNLDVSNVTNMSYMFNGNSISDLTSLAHWDTSKVTDMSEMFENNKISDLKPLANWNVSNVTDMSYMFNGNSISDLTSLAHWDTSKVTDMSAMFQSNQIRNLTSMANWNTSNVTGISYMFAGNYDLIDLKPIANWNISNVKNDESLFDGAHKLNLININNTPLMQSFLKTPKALRDTFFITNNADLVKATTGKDIPTLTNTAKRTITFNIPHADPEPIVQIINYKAIAPAVQVSFDFISGGEIVKTYPVKESDWQLDTSKQNDAIIVNGQIHFKAVKIPHINGYKARITRNKINPAMLMVSFMAVPSENKPSLPDEEKPSKPSAPSDSQFTDLDHKVVDVLNQSDSGWTMQNTQPATYTVEVPADNTIDLSDLVIAEPVHAMSDTIQIHVTKRFKLSKKHSSKHLKHRKKAVRTFRKYRL